MKKTEWMAKIAVDKSLVKEHFSSDYRTVYLEDGQEFQIQIFNPKTYTIGVSISLNGETDNQYLVLRPGERVWLDRFLSKPKKFKFSTYFVEDSKEAKEAIANNGIVNIRFYKEKQLTSNWYTLTTSSSPWNNDVICRGADCVPLGADRILYSGVVNDLVYNENSNIHCNANIVDMNHARSKDESVLTSIQTYASTSIETGRIEEGSHSNQQFNTVYTQFESFSFYDENIKILPKSQQPVTIAEIAKRYCHQCGRKLSQKYKFCPFCGSKQ